MATTTAVASANARSSGKMLRSRRAAGFRSTPYDRPSPATYPSPGTGAPNHVSNWLSRFIISPSRLIADGAGKVLASVFGSDTTSASESSSDSSSEEDMDTINSTDCTDISPDTCDPITQVNVAPDIADNLQNFSWSTDSKRKLAKLLALETYSREECAALTKIIEAKVIKPSIVGMFGRDNDRSNLHNNAVIEAKRWLEKKKSDCISKLDLEHEHCTLNSSVEPQKVSETELISPVNIAKSYMEALPPWASPYVARMHGTSHYTGLHLFREVSPHSVSGNLLKLSKQSPLSGSWSLQEELRKVRFKSSEDMLRNRSPSRNDWSPLSLNRGLVSASICDGFLPPDTSILGSNQCGADKGHVEGGPDLNVFQKDPAMQAMKPVTESDNHVASHDSSNNCNNGTASGATADQTHQVAKALVSSIREVKGALSLGVVGEAPEVAANGFPAESSGQGIVEGLIPPYQNHFGSNLDKEQRVSLEAKSKFISDYLLDVPTMDENDTVGIASHNSSGGNQVDHAPVGQHNSKRSRATDVTLKQRAKRVSRYNRRGKKNGE